MPFKLQGFAMIALLQTFHYTFLESAHHVQFFSNQA